LFRIAKDFEIPQFEFDAYVDVNDNEKAFKWFKTFESKSKIMMLETKHYEIKGKHVLFQEMYHCIHSDIVKKK